MKENLLSDHPEGVMVTRLIAAILQSVDPQAAVQKRCRLSGELLTIGAQVYDLSEFKNIHVIGFGKAVLSMAVGIVEVLGKRIKDGFLITKHFHAGQQALLPDAFTIVKGNHPVPAEDTFASSRQLVDFAQSVLAEDLVIVLISGGGSALCSSPVNAISPADMQAVTRSLLACGAEIQEMNAVRKHLDQIKGGGLAELLQPATVATLILSDVIGSPLDVIASGPTVPDSSTYEDVANIFNRYFLWEEIPETVGDWIRTGQAGKLPDTPKSGSPCFDRVQNILVADNRLACETAVNFAKNAGIDAHLMTTSLNGEAREVGRVLVSLMRQIRNHDEPFLAPVCLVYGGETTVTLKGSGKGGRNQEIALGALRELDGLEDVLMVTLATDGEDGPTDAAGAWATGDSLARASQMGLSLVNAMNTNDSYQFFTALNQIVHTGPTGTNVNDVTLCFVF